MFILWVTLVLLAHVILPSAYAVLCLVMLRRKVWWFNYLAYLFVFGAFGGSALMLELVGLGPAPLFTLPAMASELFLLTVGVGACLISSLILQFRRKKGWFEKGALIGGYTFVLLHSAFIAKIGYDVYRANA
jgi:hypothetical protein